MTQRMLVFMTLVLAACGERQPGPPRRFDPGPVPSNLVAGEAMFNQNCSKCHGNRAMGTDLGPPLVHIIYQPSHHSDEAFRRAVSLGVVPHHWSFGSMPAQPDVAAEIEEIIRYVRWLQREAGIT